MNPDSLTLMQQLLNSGGLPFNGVQTDQYGLWLQNFNIRNFAGSTSTAGSTIPSAPSIVSPLPQEQSRRVTFAQSSSIPTTQSATKVQPVYNLSNPPPFAHRVESRALPPQTPAPNPHVGSQVPQDQASSPRQVVYNQIPSHHHGQQRFPVAHSHRVTDASRTRNPPSIALHNHFPAQVGRDGSIVVHGRVGVPSRPVPPVDQGELPPDPIPHGHKRMLVLVPTKQADGSAVPPMSAQVPVPPQLDESTPQAPVSHSEEPKDRPPSVIILSPSPAAVSAFEEWKQSGRLSYLSEDKVLHLRVEGEKEVQIGGNHLLVGLKESIKTNPTVFLHLVGEALEEICNEKKSKHSNASQEDDYLTQLIAQLNKHKELLSNGVNVNSGEVQVADQTEFMTPPPVLLDQRSLKIEKQGSSDSEAPNLTADAEQYLPMQNPIVVEEIEENRKRSRDEGSDESSLAKKKRDT